MWIISKDGYQSIVEYQPHFILPKTRKEAYGKLTAEERKLGRAYKPATQKMLGSHLLVRARINADLDKLEKFAAERNSITIRTTDKAADYHYRMIVDRTIVGAYFGDLIAKLDYASHVKEVVRDNAPPSEGYHSRYSGMFDIWDATSRWQKDAPYSGGKWSRGSYSGSKDSFPPPTGYISWIEYFEKQDKKRPKSLLESVMEKKDKDGSWNTGKQESLPLGSFDEDGDLIKEPHIDENWLEETPLPEDVEWLNRQKSQITFDEDDLAEEQIVEAHAADDTRLHNEYLTMLVLDALTEDYGGIPISEIPENEIAQAFRRVLSDESLIDN